MEKFINIKYEYTSNIYKAKQWLHNLPDIFAADLEVASKFTSKQKNILNYKINNFNYNYHPNIKRVWQQQIDSNGLSHPSLTTITHLSIGISESFSYVIICDSPSIKKLILDFLISTDKTQIWHNCLFDFKHIYYYTKQIPKNFVDTMLIAKSLLNYVDAIKSKVGLKELMGYKYGDWALIKSDNNFTLENMQNKKLLKYTAIDSMATYALYKDILESIKNK